ncbi:MAG: putative non-heme bromoperoxidase BpoC [Chloroflexi bacterium ADurb.Bin360]|nr:MAG: putative non-heme bromoperoxidase BpoC [Chloroflexi bacterium ADurb.Bin360]
MFENRPQFGLVSPYGFLKDAYNVFAVLRKPGLPVGYSMKDMADDYAGTIREEFGGPVNIIGVSTGGSIAQHFAADHPELVRRLVLHSSAHTLSEAGKQMQIKVAQMAKQGRWYAASAAMMGFILPRTGLMKVLTGPLNAIISTLMALSAPKDPNDLVVTVEAEDKHAFRERLPEITAPTLVIAGAEDPFYTPDLFRETAEGISHARLILYEGMGHAASGKRLQQAVLSFLKET